MSETPRLGPLLTFSEDILAEYQAFALEPDTPLDVTAMMLAQQWEIAAQRARVAALEQELETEQIRLAACAAAALGNTAEAVAQRLTRESPYWSASYGDVCSAVDREMTLRRDRDTALYHIGTAASFLKRPTHAGA